jgi:hypothetical protein
MFSKIFGFFVNLLLLGNIFYIIWIDKLSSVILFLLALLCIWKVQRSEKFLFIASNILLYCLYPFVFVISSVYTLQDRIIVAVLYLPVIFKIIPSIISNTFDEKSKEISHYSNLIYLYFSPVFLLQKNSIAFGILAVYALVYIFGWEKYILRNIPVWERIVHLIGLSAVLLLLSTVLV